MYNNMQGQGWGRPQQPQMTGYPQQQQQPGSGFLQPQQTGYPGMSQFQRPMQTGMPYQQQQQPQQGLAPQQTGMMGGMGMQQLRPQPTSQFLSPGPTGMGMGMSGGLQPQPTGYMGGLQPQQTGFMGGGGLQMQQTGLMPQMTGMPIRDPRMQLMSAQFLPASQPFSGAPVAGNMNFNQASMQPSNFQSQIQNLSQQQQGSKEPRIPWALTKEERKSYDAIFRAWDAQGTGFINGEVAREVFGQSGLETEKLMQIWHLADTGNRGKLNVNEFHVAMGLIYRALNGNDVPETLPSELIPPSAKDLNDSVDFLKDLLKKDTNVRHSTGLNIPEAGSNSGASYAKARSFHENPVAPKKDATAYKHDDTDVAGYKSSSRHLDRKTVRYEGQSATDDLSEMKRQLANTQKMLDKQGAEDDEDRELEREMDDLRYRIRRVQDDIEYFNRRGGRDSADLRRKAERELMHLMHERLPQLEKRIEAKDSRQRERDLDQSRERDRRNDPYSRYSSSSSDRDRLRDDDRSNSRSGSTLGDGEYLRGTFDCDSNRRRDDADSYRRRGDDDRDSRPSAASAPPPPPVEPAKPAAPSPAPSTPAPSSGPPKNMSAEERAAWIRSEAQRRVQERMRMLGAVAPAGPTPFDTSVEERLKAEQAEAAAKSAQADQEAAAREEARKARLEEHRLQTEKASLATVKQEIKQAEKGDNLPPAPIVQAAKEEIDNQEEMIRRREEVLAKEKAEREARLRRLEEQEEEARKQEEAFKERQSMFNSGVKSASSALPAPSRKSGKSAAPPPPPPSRARAAPAPAPAAPAPAAPAAAAPAPPSTLAPPEALPAPAQPSPTPSTGSSTNPFHRMQQGAGGTAASPSSAVPAAPAASTPGGGTNPFFRPQQPAAESNLPPATRATPPVSAQPTGATSKSASRTIHTAPKHDDDDWEDSDKDEDEDEADGPGSSTRATRQNLAQALFSNLIPSSGRSTPPASAPSAPAPPPAPPAAPGAPSAPAAPAAPAAPVIKPAAGPVDRGALLGQIQGGLKLKKAQTNDRSKALVTGNVIGDASPPVQQYVPPPSPPAAPVASSAVAERSIEEADDGNAPAPPPAPSAPPAPSMPGTFDSVGDFASSNPNRQSVDWANSLANDQANTKAAFAPDEPSVREEAEEDSPDEDEGPEDLDASRKPGNGHATAGQDEVEGFDLSRMVRVRTLYGYAGQRDEDLSFEENDVLSAHPARDADSAWWYGSLASGSKKGFFPRSYVEPIDKPTKAKALYDYSGASAEEASFVEGDTLLVVDQEDANWWRVDVGGSKILVAPATYLELSG